MDCATGHHTYIEISEADGKETAPGKEHVVLVQKSGEAPDSEARAAEGRAREAIELASGKVTQRVAGKRVERKEGDVKSEDQCAYAHTKAAVEEKRTEGVVPEKRNKENGKIEEVAMEVLKDEGKSCFAAIIPARGFTHGAGRRIEKKRAIVGFAVVVACGAKAQRANKNQ